MSAIAIVSSFIVSCLGILSNCSIIVLVILSKQLNSPNRILLLHLGIICLALSLVYLWVLINNSIMITMFTNSSASPSSTSPESAAITTSISSSPTSNSTLLVVNNDSSILLPSLSPSTTSSTDSIYDSFCSINDLFIHLLQPISLWTISCINFDRYYAICSPLHYNTLFTTKKVTIFLCSGWFIILLTIFPIYLMLILSADDRNVMSVCWFRKIDIRTEWDRNVDKDYYWFEVQILLTTLLTIFLPISLIIACNIRVLTIANYQRHRIASAIYESVLSAQVAITHQKNPFPPVPNLFGQPFPIAASIYPPKPNPFELRRKSQKAALVVFELIASVVIIYSPYYLFVIFYGFYRKSHHFRSQKDIESSEAVMSTAIFLVQFLLLCSPTINAILYGFKNKTMQESIHNFWRKQKTKIELHYEIQARTPSTCGSRRASMTEITTNFHPHQPQLKRQLSEFFFGTSSSLTSQLNEDQPPHKMYRTPSDSLFTTNSERRSSHHEYLSPNFDPLGKMNSNTATATTSSSSPPTTSLIKHGISPSASKNLLSNFKKLLVGSKNDINSSSNECNDNFPQILITKFSDSLLNTQQSSQSTSRRDSENIQQVEIGNETTPPLPSMTTMMMTMSTMVVDMDVDESEQAAEQEPLLTTQTHSLDDFYTTKSSSSKSAQQYHHHNHKKAQQQQQQQQQHSRPMKMRMKMMENNNVKFQTL